MKKKINFGALDPRENTPWGIVITLFFLAFGGYLIYKHRKDAGFWWGFLSLALLSTYIIISPKPVTVATSSSSDASKTT